jgi:hypothetical protein
MLPDDTVCKVLGVQPGIPPAAVVPVEVGVLAGGGVELELVLAQPVATNPVAANAASPTPTRFTVLPYVLPLLDASRAGPW